MTAALPPDAVLFGFSADAVAVTVRRALAKATGWADHHWNIIAPTVLPTHVNVALDEVLTEEVGAGRRNPTLRFWDWEEPSVVIGSFQSVRNELHPDGVARHGISVVRRISGGGAMFMEAGNCITYSLYLPQTLVDGISFADSYAFLDAWVMAALEKLGISAFYVPLNDIATDQGKIGGAAQKRLANGGMLHHVTMSYDIDADKMVEVLRIGKEKLSDKGTTQRQEAGGPAAPPDRPGPGRDRRGHDGGLHRTLRRDAVGAHRGRTRRRPRHGSTPSSAPRSGCTGCPRTHRLLSAETAVRRRSERPLRSSRWGSRRWAWAVRARSRWLRCSMMIRRRARGASGCSASQSSVADDHGVRLRACRRTVAGPAPAG